MKRYKRLAMSNSKSIRISFAVLVCVAVFGVYYWRVPEGIVQMVKTLDEDYSVDWDAIKPRRVPEKHLLHDKWIVITTVNPPTSDVKKLASIPGWKIVIVGDTKSPKNWSYPNCIHLSVNDQLKLNYKVTDLIKYRSYARKNIGYLYAIQHGANIIYETDDDNSPITKDIGFDKQSKLTYSVYHSEDNNHVMNPFAHFGQSSIWPRGYPLDKIGIPNSYLYRQCKGKKALVQQGLVNGDPDVDAIFRLTRKNTKEDLKVYFDAEAKPLMLPKGIIAPFNSQNTLFLYDAFFGLVLPQTVAFRVCDIWRGYWAQRLFWELDGYVSYFAPNAYTVRNAHSFLEDFVEERELYHLSSKLTRFLVQWKSSKKDFFEIILDLSIDMAREGFWKKDDVMLVKYWLIDLISLGYKVPVVKPDSKICDSKIELIKPNEKNTSYLKLQKKS